MLLKLQMLLATMRSFTREMIRTQRGQTDKKPGASGRVFAITEGQAANTSGTIT
nr:hypothetical protein [Tanacetum cinerariifolium]